MEQSRLTVYVVWARWLGYAEDNHDRIVAIVHNKEDAKVLCVSEADRCAHEKGRFMASERYMKYNFKFDYEPWEVT